MLLGNITIKLANATASNNNADKIQAAIQALNPVAGSDFTKMTVTTSGKWDNNTLGNDLVKATSTLVGGTTEVKGSYTMDINTAFDVGDNVVIKGQTFKAVANNADSTKGEFNIAAGNLSSQASGLIDAINANATLVGTYTASATGSTITLSENTATGTDMKAKDLKVVASGVPGQYTVDTSELMTNGASLSIDGQSITVSDKSTHVGYANGTAVKEATTADQQTQALADAVNKNTTLNQLYTASVATDGSLQLDQKFGNTNAPVVETTTSTKGDFNTSFQVGAKWASHKYRY